MVCRRPGIFAGADVLQPAASFEWNLGPRIRRVCLDCRLDSFVLPRSGYNSGRLAAMYIPGRVFCSWIGGLPQWNMPLRHAVFVSLFASWHLATAYGVCQVDLVCPLISRVQCSKHRSNCF